MYSNFYTKKGHIYWVVVVVVCDFLCLSNTAAGGKMKHSPSRAKHGANFLYFT